MPLPAVVFDLDGTLIDSAPDLRAALNRALAGRGLPALADDAVRRMIGDGAKLLVERGFAAFGQQADEAALDEFLAFYEAAPVAGTRIYPGIPEALERLRRSGYALGICTNKPSAATAIVLRALGLEGFFQAVAGGDCVARRKPDPQHLAFALEAMGAGSGIMVGDHANDMAAAAGLRMPSIFVGWGYGEAVGTRRAETAAQLPALIAELSASRSSTRST